MSASKKNHICFIPLALNQSLFYLELAKELSKSNDTEVSFLSCHERSHFEFIKAGFNSFNFHAEFRKFKKSSSFSMEKLNELSAQHGIDDPKLFVAHERAAYLLEDAELYPKMYHSLLAMQSLLTQISQAHPDTKIVQELGGFLSVLSSFKIARKLNLDNYFIEPSFFRGHFFLVKNQIDALKVEDTEVAISDELKNYLQKTIHDKAIVIPTKDKHHYQAATAKFFNFHNFKRFHQKMADKYIRGYGEEFQYIHTHFYKHATAILNSRKLKPFYQQPKNEGFIYYPLHVPADIALTIRSPRWLDQIETIGKIAKQAPKGMAVYFKEHPAMIGAISADKMIKLLKENSNVRLIHPSVNNFELLRTAHSVVTVNSKAGAEALLFEKPVYVLGDAFYRKCKVVNTPADIASIDFTKSEGHPPPLQFFQNVMNQSLKGDLYNLDAANIKQFAASLLQLPH